MFVNLLKWLGLVPAADGLLGQVLDVDSMKSLDLLRGYLGVFPHALGIVLFFVFRLLATRWNTGAPTAAAERRRLAATVAAAILFCVCVVLWFASVPETAPQPIIRGRWVVATLFYLSFYTCLGLSQPEL